MKIILSLLATVCILITSPAHSESIKQKKLSFFEHVYPLIEKENISVLKTRKEVIEIRDRLLADRTLSKADKNRLSHLAKKYNLSKSQKDNNILLDQLLVSIDIIPPSLAMAQSANESAWGKSRFARQANNYFGQWCFSKGCGIIPKQRSAKSRHEVRRFDSVQASVRSYIKNINTTRAYSGLRKIRHKLRLSDQQPSGHKLAKGLLKYSSRGAEYVKEIRAMIRQNKLVQYDQRFLKVIKDNKSI